MKSLKEIIDKEERNIKTLLKECNDVKTLEHNLTSLGYVRYTDKIYNFKYSTIHVVLEIKKSYISYITLDLYFSDGKTCIIAGFIKYNLQ